VKWLRVDRLLGEMGIFKDNAAGQREFERATEARRAEANEEEWKRVRRGWCLGGETFREKILARMDGTVGAEHFGEESEPASSKMTKRHMKSFGERSAVQAMVRPCWLNRLYNSRDCFSGLSEERACLQPFGTALPPCLHKLRTNNIPPPCPAGIFSPQSRDEKDFRKESASSCLVLIELAMPADSQSPLPDAGKPAGLAREETIVERIIGWCSHNQFLVVAVLFLIVVGVIAGVS